MKKDIFLRIVFYAAGLLILALGIILNTKSGLGTVIAVLGVGRVIAVFNHLFMKKMTAAAGVEY